MAGLTASLGPPVSGDERPERPPVRRHPVGVPTCPPELERGPGTPVRSRRCSLCDRTRRASRRTEPPLRPLDRRPGRGINPQYRLSSRSVRTCSASLRTMSSRAISTPRGVECDRLGTPQPRAVGAYGPECREHPPILVDLDEARTESASQRIASNVMDPVWPRTTKRRSPPVARWMNASRRTRPIPSETRAGRARHARRGRSQRG